MDKTTWDNIVKNGIYSQELDWLAIDNKEQIGIFTAMMNAPIPDKVKSSYEDYQQIRQIVESTQKTTSAVLVTSEKGNFNDWIVYADKGFFAFDF